MPEMDAKQRRKPRENGWLDASGVTHHIDTRRTRAYHRDIRTATCGASLCLARRVPVGRVDCMTCIVRVSRRPRLAPPLVMVLKTGTVNYMTCLVKEARR